MFAPFSIRPALPLAGALLALAGLTSGAQAAEREETTTSIALAFPAAPSTTTDATLPTNITAPSTLAHLLRQMLTVSATFRRQCARIARASEVRVKITLGQPRHAHAASMIEYRNSGTWTATVEVFIDNHLPEMLAHELEHVIEHIDGVDLRQLATQGLDGVQVMGDELYETARAIAAGKRVAAEFAARHDQPAGPNERPAS